MARHSCAVVLLAWAGLLTAQVSPTPARQLSNAGDPITLNLPCDATVASIGAGTLFLDTTPSRIGKRPWLCSTTDGITFSWQSMASNISATVQPVITNQFSAVATTYAGYVLDSRAALGMTASMEPIGNPGGLYVAIVYIATAGRIDYTIMNLGLANAKLQNTPFAIYMHTP